MDTHDDTNFSHSTSSFKEQIDSMIQDPQQCHATLELFLERTDILGTFPSEVWDRITHNFHTNLPNPDIDGTHSIFE
jgi:hypothetical protein